MAMEMREWKVQFSELKQTFVLSLYVQWFEQM